MCRWVFFKRPQLSTKRIFYTGLLFISIFLSAQAIAQGNLVVMPRRVIFEGNTKSQELNLANIGKDTARFSISVIDVRMKEDGGFEVIQEPDPGQFFAGKYLRFFPGSVTLAPNESQVIKLQVFRSGGMQPGEYRSHMYFRAIPDEKVMDQIEPGNDSSISIRIAPVFGISIPVFIRSGETSVQVNMTDVALEYTKDSVPVLNLLFLRSGNRSVYGDFAVNFIPKQGKAVQVGVVKGVAVYTPNKSRQLKLELTKSPGIDFHSGKLQLVYSTSADARYAKFAEAELLLH